MNEQVIRDACAHLSFRQCATFHGVTYTTWKHVRLTGELPPERRGRPTNNALTEAILATIRQHPHFSIERIAFTLGCSKWKVARVCKQHGLVYLWQRIRYADVELKELDPDLIKARQSPLLVDGPGALVHMDCKKYASLKGGLWVVGVTLVDNFSGFVDLYLCPDGRKSAENTIRALEQFLRRFPCPVKKLYSDRGSEFLNSRVMAYCEAEDIKYRQTKPGHPWSNGKAERAQALIKREIIVPLMATTEWPDIASLQGAIDELLDWFNTERAHFGKVNHGIPPRLVAEACCGLNEQERDKALTNLRQGFRWANRGQWIKEVHSRD